MKDEGYVADFDVASEGGKSTLTVDLKYYEGRPSSTASSASAGPACASTAARTSCRKVLGGMGVAIVSTPQGVMTDRKARATARAAKSSASWPER